MSALTRTGLACLLCLSAAPLAQAQDYQLEAGFMHTTTDIDPNSDMTVTAVGGKYYFAPVSPSGPLAEAAFMAKAGGVLLLLGDVEATIGNTDADGDTRNFAVDYVLPENDILLGFETSSADLSVSWAEFETTSNSIRIGKYLDDNSALAFDYASGSVSITGNPDIDTSAIGLSGKFLLDAGGNTANVEAAFSSEKEDDGQSTTNNVLTLSGDYYLDETFSLGLGFSNNSGDRASEEGREVSLQMKKFLNETVSVDVEYTSFSADSNAGDDSSTLSLLISGRF